MNIFVGNLSLETTEDELRRVFTAFGQVLSVTMMNNKYIGSGQPGGYGYIEMASKTEGTTAVATLEGKKLRNRIVSVIAALPLSHKVEPASTGIRSNRRANRERETSQQTLVESP